MLFPSGSAQLQPGGEKQLASVAQRLIEIGSRIPKEINWVLQVDGHTDDKPIRSVVYPSNWELSAARASSVVRLFIDNGVAQARLSVIGYGPNRPVTSNETAEGRARNRRVTVMILAETPGAVVDIPLDGAASAR